jgi:DNA (cytosine-5)-methyltransferase 1
MQDLGLFDAPESDYFDSIAEFFSLDQTTSYLDEFGLKLRKWAMSNIPQINVVSIFSGAGGLDIGFRDTGFHIASHLEIEEDFCTTLEMNSVYYDDADIINTDIRQYIPNNIQCDFIIGGPPCQTFSAAGRRAAGVQGIEDNRGTLFEEYIRLLKHYQPKGFLFENVYGITGAQSGKAWDLIKSEFTNAGYTISYRILNTADYGVPQFRERMIVIGIRNGIFKFPRPTHGPDSLIQRDYYTAQQALLNVSVDEDITKLKVNGQHGYLLNDIPPGMNYSFYTAKLGHPQPIFAWRSKFSDYLYKAAPDKPVRTIKAQAGQYTGPLHWENRYLAINEFKRLQTFPDFYQMYGSRQKILQQIGNSVPPQFARMLALSILDQVFRVKLPFTMNYLADNEGLSFRKRKALLTDEYTQKANEAITRLYNSAPHTKDRVFSLKDDINYTIMVTSFFKTIVNTDQGSNVHVFSEDDALLFEIFNDEKKDIFYEVIITPCETQHWNIAYKSIILRAYSGDIWSYTVCWKALDYFLKINKIKDDIVQLNGYYQYTPAIDVGLYIKKQRIVENPSWYLLSNILKLKPIRKILSYPDFANILNIQLETVNDAAYSLKGLGYEIRNHNTNPQIKTGNILLPYIFPTLTNLSVQLRKKL